MQTTVTETITKCDGCGKRLETIPSFMYMNAGMNMMDYTTYGDINICKGCAPTVLEDLMTKGAVALDHVKRAAEDIQPNVVAV